MRSTDNQNPWTILSRETVFEDPWLRLVQHQVRDAREERRTYATVQFKKRGVSILPIDHEGYTYLIGQWRLPLERYCWELPAGGCGRDESPIAGARRELKEEAGFSAREWRELLRIDLSTAITDETATCFLAWQLDRCVPAPDPQEILAERRLPFAEVLELVWNGEITDALSVAAVLKVHGMALRGELPEDLAGLLAT
jgi:ADP-ribose pyrophosphatase